MTPRAQLKHVLLDVNFKDKPKVIEFESEFGSLARLLYMDIQAAMSAATNARISRGVVIVLANRIGIDSEKANQILDYLLKNEMLITEEGKISSLRVIRDQETYYKRSRKSNTEVADDMPLAGINDATKPEKSVYVDVNDLVIGIKELDTPQIRAALKMWAAKLQQRDRILDQTTLDPMLAMYAGRPKDFEVDLLYSASRSKNMNLLTCPLKEVDRYIKKEPQVRRVINNYMPPTREEAQKPSAESKARVRELIANSFEKIKGVA
jgi:hypothetical protein